MVLMKFVVLRDGRIVEIEHEKASGQFMLDAEAKRALSKTILPPLPRDFPEERLTVHLYFNYRR
jgi:TonB family protein